MTPHERNVMEQALETLEMCNGAEIVNGVVIYTDQEITAIKEALAQQSNEQVEPVAWLWVVDGKHHNVTFGGANSNTPKDWTVLPLYTHPPVPMAQPKEPEQEPDLGGVGVFYPTEQEPVAWLRKSELADLRKCNYRRLGADSPSIWAPNAPDASPPNMGLVAVYTTPPQRPSRSDIKPLTNEQVAIIYKAWQEVGADIRGLSWGNFVKEIALHEAAHGIKE